MLERCFAYPSCHAHHVPDYAPAAGMHLMCLGGIFERKQLMLKQVLPVAAAYVGFIVFNNFSLKVRLKNRFAAAPTPDTAQARLANTTPRSQLSIAALTLWMDVTVPHAQGLPVGSPKHCTSGQFIEILVEL